MLTARSVIPAANIVSTFAASIVNLLPILSNTIPVRILPRPLNIASTPTRVVAKATSAPTESAKSRAKLITALPTAVLIQGRQKLSKM